MHGGVTGKAREGLPMSIPALHTAHIYGHGCLRMWAGSGLLRNQDNVIILQPADIYSRKCPS